MNSKYKKIETKIIHSGEPHPLIDGAVSMPIFQSSTFEYWGADKYEDVRYIRLNNTPNHIALHKKLASLENGEEALVTSSGMSAISTTLLSLLRPGDHFLVQDCIYGGTFGLITKDLKTLNISYDFFDGNDINSIKEKIRPETKLIYLESISNPLMKVADIKGIVKFARSNNLTSIIDNTFATPINFLPLDIGFDLCIHSCTKYLNGHSDIVAGAVIGRGEMIGKIRDKLNRLGGSLDPHACYLLHRGIKTLAVRVRYQNKSAMMIAQVLESNPQVEKVNYPGLKSHPNHNVASTLFGGYGGMLSFELKGGLDAAERFLKRVKIPIVAPSLGGVETLITQPARTSHAGMTPEERNRMGIGDNLIRISVGLESTEELIDDFIQALQN